MSLNYCAKGHHIPDGTLNGLCPTCVKQQGDNALAAQQPEYLCRAARGDFGYSLRVVRGGDKHVLMFTSHASHIRTFCGIDLKSKPSIDYAPYSEATLATVCAACRRTMIAALEESFQ